MRGGICALAQRCHRPVERYPSIDRVLTAKPASPRPAEQSTMLENAGLIILVTTIVLVVTSAGAGIVFFVGRKKAGAGLKQIAAPAPVPHGMVRELTRCMRLGDQAVREATHLSQALAAQSPPLARELSTPIRQLSNTVHELTGGLNHLARQVQIEPQPRVTMQTAARAVVTQLEPKPVAVLNQAEVDAARRDASDDKPVHGLFDDSRRFPRASFRGTAKATIYPRNPVPGREPVQCTVLTRDLSCGGIGIAHCEQLFPKQIVVLDAVGKLLVGEVRWCRRVDENFYVAGCRLVKTHV